MGEQQIYLFKHDYDAMDAVPPESKDQPITSICTGMQLQAGDLLQWYTTKRHNHREHQWYRITEVLRMRTSRANPNRPLRYELLVEPVQQRESELLAAYQEQHNS